MPPDLPFNRPCVLLETSGRKCPHACGHLFEKNMNMNVCVHAIDYPHRKHPGVFSADRSIHPVLTRKKGYLHKISPRNSYKLSPDPLHFSRSFPASSPQKDVHVTSCPSARLIARSMHAGSSIPPRSNQTLYAVTRAVHNSVANTVGFCQLLIWSRPHSPIRLS